METINFPLTISEVTKMREDGDKVSLFFSYWCMACCVLVLIFWVVYYLSSYEMFKVMSLISLCLAAVFLLVVYIYRPHFLLGETRRKYKALDKLEGAKYEEAMEQLTPDEREEYLKVCDELDETDKISCIKHIFNFILKALRSLQPTKDDL